MTLPATRPVPPLFYVEGWVQVVMEHVRRYGAITLSASNLPELEIIDALLLDRLRQLSGPAACRTGIPQTAAEGQTGPPEG